MIDEQKLAELRFHWDFCKRCTGNEGCKVSWAFADMQTTLIKLWTVARLARVYRRTLSQDDVPPDIGGVLVWKLLDKALMELDRR